MTRAPAAGAGIALEAAFRGAVRDYLLDPGELHLSRAYEIGREALMAGRGVLEFASWQQAAAKEVIGIADREARLQSWDAASRFLAESLSPFEMSHRGVRESALALRRLNEDLEAEACRVGQRLHDEAGQLLATVHLALIELKPGLDGQAQRRVDEVVGLLREVEGALRDLSHELRPSVLEDLGLLPALRFLGEQVARRSRLQIRVEGNLESRLPPRLETALYRAAQEALGNIVKHARARRVAIRVRRGSRRVSCRIVDDGVGLERGPGSGRSGLGLIGIRERLDPLGGDFRLTSASRGGASLLVVIPLEGARCAGAS